MASNLYGENWELKELIACTEDRNISYGIVQPGQNIAGGVPVVRVNNFKDGVLDVKDVIKVSRENEAGYKRTRLRGGEVLLTLVGSTGQSAIVPHSLEGWNVARAVAVIRPLHDIGPNWINICLQSSSTHRFLNDRANTTVQKTINLADVKKIPIPVPPKEVRTGIESIIISINKKIDINRQSNNTLDTIAQAVFKSWFVDFDPVKAKITAIEQGEDPIRAAMLVISGKTGPELDQMPVLHFEQLAATAALFPEEMEGSELGDVPKGWEVKRVRDILELVYGKALKSSDRKEGPIPVYGSGGITGYHNKPLVPHGAIIVGRKGTVGSLFWEDGPFFPIDTTYYVRPITAPLSFCYYAMQGLGLEKMNTDAAVPGLNRDNAYRLEVIVSDKNILEKYDDIVMSLRSYMRKNQDESIVLEELRYSLLPRLLSGEISVNDLSGEVAL